MRSNYWITLVACVVLFAVGSLLPSDSLFAQLSATATPAPIRLASVTPLPQIIEITPTLSVRGETATPVDILLIETLGEVNVRSSPEIGDDNLIGSLGTGERLVVTGRYFNWFEFQYELSPTNRGWVYADLVTVLGDISAIPTVDAVATPTADPLVVAPTLTREALLELPGGVLTVTAQSRIIEIPEQQGDDNTFGILESTPLPTFTYPPEFANIGVPTLQVTRDVRLPNSNTRTSETPLGTDRMSPLLLIVMMGALGTIGLIVSVMR